MNMEMQ